MDFSYFYVKVIIYVYHDLLWIILGGGFWRGCTLGWRSKKLVILFVTSVLLMSLSCFKAGKQIEFSLIAFYLLQIIPHVGHWL